MCPRLWLIKQLSSIELYVSTCLPKCLYWSRLKNNRPSFIYELTTLHLLLCAPHYAICPPGGSLLPLQMPNKILWSILSSQFPLHFPPSSTFCSSDFIISLLLLYFSPPTSPHNSNYYIPGIQRKTFKTFQHYICNNLDKMLFWIGLICFVPEPVGN